VGCASHGQGESLEAPKGGNKPLPITAADARALAYYQTTYGLGILAPRGWYCEGYWGSGGGGLLVSSKPIQQNTPIDGPAISIYRISNENSGRYDIAEIIARALPAYRAHAKAVWADLDSPFPSGPYPADVLVHRRKTVVDYKTPPHTEGLGTRFSSFKNNDRSIAGAAILLGEPPADLLLLAVRMPSNLDRLAPLIIHEVEREAAHRK